MLIYKTFFRQNGGKGFVKKSYSILNNLPRKRSTITITIISASKLHTLLLDRTQSIDPCVVVDLYDFDPKAPDIDGKSQSRSTGFVKNNGWNPAWTRDNELTFTNVCIETAFVVIKAKDKELKKDEDIGRVVIPLAAARQGYRTVNLETKTGIRTDGSQILLKYEVFE